MVLKNKDGTPYGCKRPNPLTKGQIWLEDYELHNCDFPIVETENKKIVEPPPTLPEPKIEPIEEVKVVVEEPVVEPVIEPEPEINAEPELVPVREEPIKEEPAQVPDPPEIEIIERANEKPPKYQNVIVFHCLPTTEDDSKSYFKPYDFEGFIVQAEDLQLIFWSTIEIPSGSIVYPYRFSVKKLQYPGYRWWRTIGRQSYKGGYLNSCVVSEFCPDFTA